MYKPDVVIYHNPCDDGWVAALIVSKFYAGQSLDDYKPEFLEGNYGNKDIDYWVNKVRDKDVLVVDFSFKGAIRKAMETACKSMLILDHHASAREEYGNDVLPLHTEEISLSVDDAETLIKDLKIVMIMSDDHCGSSMAWDFFFPGKSRPELLEYIEDQDLGRRKLPNATSFTYWIRSRTDYQDPSNYQFLDSLEDEADYHEAMAQGKAVYSYLSTAFKQAVATIPVGPAYIDDGDKNNPELTIGIAFSPYQFASELANFMVVERKLDAAIVFYHAANNGCGLSIRGRKNEDGSDTDFARRIATSLGGGGHNMAAGANFTDIEHGLSIISEIIASWND